MLVIASIAVRLLTGVILLLPACFPPFDASPLVLSSSSPYLRWDAFHFVHIAQKGYVHEHEFAFSPGAPAVMRGLTEVLKAAGVVQGESPGVLLLSGAFVALMCDASRDLYDLTLMHTKSPDTAFLTAILSLLPSSPAVLLHGSYTEPFFAFLSYRGMIQCARRKFWAASAYFALATAFRANGVLLAGYIVWGILILPALETGKIKLHSVIRTLLSAMLVVSPFLAHQSYAYFAYCVSHSKHVPRRQWCDRSIPFIYSFVQAEYWNVGFLRYWTVQQIPNFALAAPPLMLLCHGLWSYISHAFPVVFQSKVSLQAVKHEPSIDPLRNAWPLLPHALHALALVLLLIFASHVQIALRLASSLPFTYWSATSLCLNSPIWARVWIGWSIIWGATACVAWGAFLPPA